MIFQSCSHPNIKQKDIRIREIQPFTPRNVRQNPITDIAMTSNYGAREKLILPWSWNQKRQTGETTEPKAWFTQKWGVR